MNKKEFIECVEKIDDMAEKISEVGGEKNPVIVITKVDDEVIPHVIGTIGDLGAILAYAMVNHEDFCTMVINAAHTAIQYKVMKGEKLGGN